MTFKAQPPQSRLRDMFDYDPTTGILINKRLGKRAGSLVKGGNSTKWHRVVKIDGSYYMVHRVIWTWFYGDDPREMLVDHINQDSLDDRIDNLRLVTRAQNRRNSRLNRNKTSCPYRNVYPNNGKWIARVSIEGKLKSLGTYATPEEAAEAVKRVHIT